MYEHMCVDKELRVLTVSLNIAAALKLSKENLYLIELNDKVHCLVSLKIPGWD